MERTKLGNFILGRVIKSNGLFSKIVAEGDGETFQCRLRGNLRLKELKYSNPLAVGDFVEFSINDTHNKLGTVERIRPRKNFIARKAIASNKEASVLAANISYAVLITSMRTPHTPPGFIDRFIVLAEANNIETIIVINKQDLYAQDDELRAKAKRLKNIYGSLNYRVLETSTVTRQNIDELQKLLSSRISLLAGQSGVGKTSLLNAINPTLALPTAQVSSYHNKGRHTTTFAQMHNVIDKQTFIIDSPGFKELGLVYIDPLQIKNYFVEFSLLAQKCRFKNCQHINEPDCEVKEAVKRKQIEESRYRSYLNLRDLKQFD